MDVFYYSVRIYYKPKKGRNENEYELTRTNKFEAALEDYNDIQISLYERRFEYLQYDKVNTVSLVECSHNKQEILQLYHTYKYLKEDVWLDL